MSVTRVTQTMLSQRSLDHLQTGLGRLAKLQEQISSGRAITRPSDSPTDTSSAMRLREVAGQVAQHQRAAADGASWLATIDTTLVTVTDQVRQAREIGQQAVNGAMGASAREALAVSVDQLRESLLSLSNTRYLDRPVFGGVTGGDRAYDSTGTYVGQAGQVTRTVGDGVKVRVDADAQATFGPAGDDVFVHLDALATALRGNDTAAIQSGMAALAVDLDRLAQTQADVGTRAARIEQAKQTAIDTQLRLNSDLSGIEGVDLPRAVVELEVANMGYQAALGATARVLQPSLLDFLR